MDRLGLSPDSGLLKTSNWFFSRAHYQLVLPGHALSGRSVNLLIMLVRLVPIER